MQSLSRQFLDRCPIENGFRLRGHEMSRLDIFVDAAFAFAVTMLVISFDRIPQTFDELTLAIKGIPAFSVAVIQMVWIWHSHSQWSERYGLRDTRTVAYSTALLIVMLIYIYPMRIMFSGMFDWLSGGYFPSAFVLNSVKELQLMFIFLGCGIFSLCLLFFLMYRHAARKKEFLKLDGNELYESETFALVWLGSAGVCALSIILALAFPPELIPYAGFGYVLFAIWIPFAFHYRMRARLDDNKARS